jgi:hypothetical protein
LRVHRSEDQIGEAGTKEFEVHSVPLPVNGFFGEAVKRALRQIVGAEETVPSQICVPRAVPIPVGRLWV